MAKTSIVRVSSKGQVVLPAAIRNHLGLHTGAQLEVVSEPEGIRLRVVRAVARTKIEQLAGMIRARSKGRPRRLENFDAATLTRRKHR